MNGIYEKKYEVTNFFTNAQGRLWLYPLLNMLQDVATDHAQDLGFGYEDMVRENLFWVLTRQALDMKTWPKWREHVTVKTWVREGEGAASYRDFTIHSGDCMVGQCTTSWVTLSGQTRRPVFFERKIDFPKPTDAMRVSLEACKIPIREDAKEISRFLVRNSDIDMNAHVNNTKYALWILDSIPLEVQKEHVLKTYEVNFLAETRPSDEVSILFCPEIHQDKTSATQFQGYREADKKNIFTARLTYH